mmetsp:Transcript_978/g.3275  ORF Transcript_978/g.3275 Transcript_978/m.3275 type:complete len:403 (+) Transcript_978:496-1704(+)
MAHQTAQCIHGAALHVVVLASKMEHVWHALGQWQQRLHVVRLLNGEECVLHGQPRELLEGHQGLLLGSLGHVLKGHRRRLNRSPRLAVRRLATRGLHAVCSARALQAGLSHVRLPHRRGHIEHRHKHGRWRRRRERKAADRHERRLPHLVVPDGAGRRREALRISRLLRRCLRAAGELGQPGRHAPDLLPAVRVAAGRVRAGTRVEQPCAQLCVEEVGQWLQFLLTVRKVTCRSSAAPAPAVEHAKRRLVEPGAPIRTGGWLVLRRAGGCLLLQLLPRGGVVTGRDCAGGTAALGPAPPAADPIADMSAKRAVGVVRGRGRRVGKDSHLVLPHVRRSRRWRHCRGSALGCTRTSTPQLLRLVAVALCTGEVDLTELRSLMSKSAEDILALAGACQRRTDLRA